MASALQVNPSIMTRSAHGFSTTQKAPPKAGGAPASDLSLRRHQLEVYRANGPVGEYASAYERSYQLRPSGPHMGERRAQQPSGATHNNVATAVVMRDPLANPESPDEDHMGESTGAPYTSDYKATFRSPRERERDQGTEEVPIFLRGKAATHAIPPPLASHDATQEPHIAFEGSGFTTNNSFAWDARAIKVPPTSHYSQTFRGAAGTDGLVPIVADGSVEGPNWRQSNGYLKNGDILPNVHAANLGGEPWFPTNYESQSRAVQRESAEAQRPGIPTRSFQRPATAGSPTYSKRPQRIEQSAFSRSEHGPPADGLGTEHLKLRLGSRSTGLQHLSTRPHTAGLHAPGRSYLSTNTPTPASERAGAGIEEAQIMARLKQLRTSDPVGYAHELADAPRYLSTTHLIHTDKGHEQDQRARFTASRKEDEWNDGPHAGWTSSGGNEPSIENGGVRNPYQTASQRASEDIARQTLYNSINASKAPSAPQPTGYTLNEGSRELLQHASHSARDPLERYKLTSHLAFQSPSVHAGLMPPASGSQVNDLAPIQSSYSREHMPGSLHTQPVYNKIETLNGRTIVVRHETQDLHPTVQRALRVKEPPTSGGGLNHPFKPLGAVYL